MRPSSIHAIGRRIWPLLPAVLLLAIAFAYPVFQLLWLSAVDDSGLPSLEHYSRLFSSALYVKVLISTIQIAGWTTIFCLLAGYPVAYLIASASRRGRNTMMLWVLIPFWTSILVRTFAWMVILGRNGVINDMLVALQMVDAPLELIYNFTGVMIGMVHALMPLAILTMFAVMESIDPTLQKAASTLGARGGESFWRVYFPLSMPGVGAAGLLVFVTALGFFITPALLGGPSEKMIAQVIIFQLEEVLNWGFASAVAVMLMAATFIILFVFDRVLGLTSLTAGSEARGSEQAAKLGVVRRLAGVVGAIIIAALGRISALMGEFIDRVLPRSSSGPGSATVSRTTLWVAGLLVIGFLTLPSLFVIPVSFSQSQYINWPPSGFTLNWYEKYFSSPVWQSATIRSFAVGLLTATLAVLIGTPAAFVLARQKFPGKSVFIAFMLSPIILPNIIIAIALFYVYSRIGLVGTSAGLVIGHLIFALPYVIVTIMAMLKNYDVRLDQAAWSLGAGKLAAFRLITLPLIRAGIVAAFLFAFVKSFDELTVAIFVSGGLTTTLPLQMWVDAVLKVSPVLTAVSTVMLFVITVTILVADYLSRRRERLK